MYGFLILLAIVCFIVGLVLYKMWQKTDIKQNEYEPPVVVSEYMPENASNFSRDVTEEEDTVEEPGQIMDNIPSEDILKLKREEDYPLVKSEQEEEESNDELVYKEEDHELMKKIQEDMKNVLLSPVPEEQSFSEDTASQRKKVVIRKK